MFARIGIGNGRNPTAPCDQIMSAIGYYMSGEKLCVR
jgi:hypothetical protein